MSVLKALKLSDAKPTAQAKTPVERGRERLIENLALQRKLAESTIAGTVFEPPKHFVMRTNGEGVRVRVEVPRRIRKGWFEDGNRTTHCVMHYGGRAVEIAKGKSAIEVGPLANLPALIDSLIEAVRAGELDAALSNAAAERGSSSEPQWKAKGELMPR
ncbi:hypothetical protein [Microvirga makkahensis]|uniref:Uncharacterized protein n=1 Tax=Microvirga makkahensis TaxID=1128670 RepID=A0A7X3MRM1_9HYPH|nr:hypothetical protein [Microvirga makkahensis]MXQ11725.1 hypothetical protein [Microvirga makkahensis]